MAVEEDEANEAHKSAREKFLLAARQKEEEERVARLRQLEERRKSAPESSEYWEVESQKQVVEKKRKYEATMDQLEIMAGSGRAGVWAKDEFKQQSLSDSIHPDAAKEARRKLELKRALAEEEAAFQAERDARMAEAGRNAMAAAAHRKVQEKALERAKRRPNLVVRNEDAKTSAPPTDAVDAQDVETASARDQRNQVVTPVLTLAQTDSAPAPHHIKQFEEADGTNGGFQRELWPELCGDGTAPPCKEPASGLGILGGYDSDSSESGESA